jgi:hypothetical protein
MDIQTTNFMALSPLAQKLEAATLLGALKVNAQPVW